MGSCCNARGCDEFFDRRFAERLAKRYRKRGLDKVSRRMVGFLEACAFAQMRAGLLLAGSVSVVRRAIEQGLWTPGPLSKREAIGLGYAFFVSDTFGELRHAIGLEIE